MYFIDFPKNLQLFSPPGNNVTTRLQRMERPRPVPPREETSPEVTQFFQRGWLL